jgi:hypothetical protein
MPPSKGITYNNFFSFHVSHDTWLVAQGKKGKQKGGHFKE